MPAMLWKRKLGAILFVLPLLGGCFGGKTAPSADIYDLGVSATSLQTQTRAVSAKAQALVLNVVPVPGLDNRTVQWRVGESPLTHRYALARWRAQPDQMLRTKLAGQLADSYSLVPDALDPNTAVLTVTLARFEQVFTADGHASQGVVTVRAVLTRGSRALGQIVLTRANAATSQDAAGGAAALRTSADQVAQALAQWLPAQLGGAS